MPQTRAAVSPGNTVTLQISTRDSTGDLATASGVITYIFDSNGDVSTNATAVDSGVPHNPHTGVFTYDYSPPYGSTIGYYQDKWTGTIDGQSLEEVFGFTVTDSGVFQDTVLQNNNEITVTLQSDLPAADGDTLATDYPFYFTTHYTPTYSNAKEIELRIGRFIPNVPTDTVWRVILNASLDAERLTRVHPMPDPSLQASRGTREEWYLYVRRMWVRCEAEMLLLVQALQDFDIKSKELGDQKVEWDPQAMNNALDRALSCKDKYLPDLESGGIKIKAPRGFTKGLLDPDRPAFGRGSIPNDGDPFDRTPAGNTKRPTSTYRRWMTGYKPRRSW